MADKTDKLIKSLEAMDEEAMGKMSIEERMDTIEEIIENMESDEATLESSFTLYEKGMKLIAGCNEAIDRVEKEVLKLNEDGKLTPFEEE